MESPQQPETEQKKKLDNDNVSIKVNISTSSGIELYKDGLDYNGLRTFIGKLESLLC